ncbi:hypothetical protein OIU85_005845 [Salix viminalis]|uniref:Uncharacterized protein n=1 Tax=Salix viminalis TaxID=40686 RepID=A0A9Q0STH0_SALVM|nr:hypothetical protein OIU85_005845 [Salix viminalis]
MHQKSTQISTLFQLLPEHHFSIWACLRRREDETKEGDECGDLEAEIHGEESKDGDDDEGERRLVCEVFENAKNEEDAEIRNNPTKSMLPFGRVGVRADPTVGTRPDGRRMMTGGLEDAHPTASIQSARRSDQLTHGLDPTIILTPDEEVDS